jgi:hypothetical protein
MEIEYRKEWAHDSCEPRPDRGNRPRHRPGRHALRSQCDAGKHFSAGIGSCRDSLSVLLSARAVLVPTLTMAHVVYPDASGGGRYGPTPNRFSRAISGRSVRSRAVAGTVFFVRVSPRRWSSCSTRARSSSAAAGPPGLRTWRRAPRNFSRSLVGTGATVRTGGIPGCCSRG